MKYVIGVFVLNLPCSLETCGDWYTQGLRCENVPSVKNGPYAKTKFNELGKNPGDVWGDIKQLTYHSKELVSRELLNTIQKPLKLIERLVLASSNENDVILDPFSGVGTTMKVCKENKRNFICFEMNQHYIDLANNRLNEQKSDKEELS